MALDRADVSLLCVGTPSMPQGGTDLTYLRRALDDIREALAVATPPASGFHAVVVRSTVPPGTGDDVVQHDLRRHAAGGLGRRHGDVPGVPPRGLGRRRLLQPAVRRPRHRRSTRVSDLLTEMFSFLNREIRLVDVRSAEALKYACNAFHATKVSFANEMARIFRVFGVDSREVMRIFSEDTVLNISPAYLMPGFAFGGSCLPKDLRALLDMARVNALDVPLLAGTLQTNELVIARRGRPADRQPVPDGRHARPQLQDEHRRPAGEPERRARGAADRQGLRGPDLRPDHQSRSA